MGVLGAREAGGAAFRLRIVRTGGTGPPLSHHPLSPPCLRIRKVSARTGRIVTYAGTGTWLTNSRDSKEIGAGGPAKQAVSCWRSLLRGWRSPPLSFQLVLPAGAATSGLAWLASGSLDALAATARQHC